MKRVEEEKRERRGEIDEQSRQEGKIGKRREKSRVEKKRRGEREGKR